MVVIVAAVLQKLAAQPQLASDAGVEGGVPGGGRAAAPAQGAQFDVGGADAGVAQAEAGLAHQAGVEQVAERASGEGGEQVGVSLTFQVGGRVGGKGSAGMEEGRAVHRAL